ncbi:uncharacterized protein [Dermacentor albipictus]|uniref:uncharacterized protein n=1 Tax=Dermacentor albipictus TaxID=60249 RepID=UPI0038FC4645
MTTAAYLRRLFVLQVLLWCSPRPRDNGCAGGIPEVSWLPAWPDAANDLDLPHRTKRTPPTPRGTATSPPEDPFHEPPPWLLQLRPLVLPLSSHQITSPFTQDYISVTPCSAAFYGLGGTTAMTTAAYLRRLFVLQVLLWCSPRPRDNGCAGGIPEVSWLPAWPDAANDLDLPHRTKRTPPTPRGTATSPPEDPFHEPPPWLLQLRPLVLPLSSHQITSPFTQDYISVTPCSAAFYGLGGTTAMTTAAYLRRLFVLQQSLSSGVVPEDWRVGKIVPVPKKAILPAHRQSSRISHSKAVYPPPAQTTSHLRSFFVKTARDWNGLSADITHHSDTHHFKAALESLFVKAHPSCNTPSLGPLSGDAESQRAPLDQAQQTTEISGALY